jgi:hypothetical protein
MWRYFFLPIICLGAPFADAAERQLKGDEIAALLSDRTVTGGSGNEAWEQTFQKSGETIYRMAGNASAGSWKVQGDEYCSQWPPQETWSCYTVTAEENRITFISHSGRTYPGILK